MADNLKSKPESYWREKLTPDQYRVLRQGATDPAFTGALTDNHADGLYHCAACGAPLFSSDTKFESGSGWPSFYAAIGEAAVDLVDDYAIGMHRVEVKCSNCGSHLGHVFPDGPRDKGGQRFCMNSTSLSFTPLGHVKP